MNLITTNVDIAINIHRIIPKSIGLNPTVFITSLDNPAPLRNRVNTSAFFEIQPIETRKSLLNCKNICFCSDTS